MSAIDELRESERRNQKVVAEAPRLKCTPLSEVESREIEWLWKDRIPKDTLTIIEGDGGRGKSTIVASICSKLSVGERLPEDETERPPIKILLLAAEDDPACVLRPRFEAHGGDLSNVLFDDQSMVLNEAGLEALTKAIAENGIGLVVIDPVVSFLGQKVDMNKGNDVRSVLGPLVKLGRETGCTFVVVRHFNKSRDGSASQKGAGSVDFRNAARSVLQVIHSEDRSFLALEKSNYAAKAKTIEFTIQSSQVVWGEASDKSADQLHAESQASGESKSVVEEATAFLQSELSRGPKSAREMTKAAGELGIAPRTLARAKTRLGVTSVKRGDTWAWVIKANDANEQCQERQVCQPGNLGNVGILGTLDPSERQLEAVLI